MDHGDRERQALADTQRQVARALVQRATADKINLITAYSGRSDAADGETFPYVFPLSPNYWTQAGLLIDFFQKHWRFFETADKDFPHMTPIQGDHLSRAQR